MKKKILVIIIIIIILLAQLCIYFYKRNISHSNEWLYNSNSNSDNYSSNYSGGLSYSSVAPLTDSSGAASATKSLSSILSTAGSNSSESYLGYSTGGARTIENFRENINNGYFPISTDITYNGLFYDYSFDTGNAKGESDDLFYPSYSTAVSKDIISNEKEYYMSVGLNSNIKESNFVRPKLNLVIVLDNSGSMSSGFNSYYYDGNYTSGYTNESRKSKMEIADNSVNILLDHLNKDDRFGMVIFNDQGYIAKYLNEISETDVDSLKENILNIRSTGGTNFEDGYKKALEVFDNINKSDKNYQNRIIVLTDAMPNTGYTGSEGLMDMIEKSAKNNIYTSFVGIGVDFNTELIEKLGTVTGANYYSVHNESDFEKQMGEDFDFMVTPLVFDLNLDFDSKDYELEAVYGTDIENNKKGNIMHVNTLFPSRRNDSGEVKGGIILLKLKKKNNSDNGKITLKVSYEDGKREKHQNEQEVTFNNDNEYYDNTGIRKGIVLTRYANLMKDWILFERSNGNKKFNVTEETGIIYPNYDEEQIVKILGEHERTSVILSVSQKFKELFKEMKEYIESEKEKLNDDTLDQEIDILEKLINGKTSTTKEKTDWFFGF